MKKALKFKTNSLFKSVSIEKETLTWYFSFANDILCKQMDFGAS